MPSLTRNILMTAVAATAVLGWSASTTPVQAQYGGYRGGHHGDYDHGPRHGPRLRFGPGAIGFDGGYGPPRRRHHSHCREIEYRDHHGHYRVRTVCDD